MKQLDLFSDLPTDDRIREFEEACRLAAKCEKSLAPVRFGSKTKCQRVRGMTRQELNQHRLKIAHEVLAQGGSVSEFARRAGIVSSWASEWLKTNHPDLHQDLIEQAHPIMLSRPRRVARLTAVKVGEALNIPFEDIADRLRLQPGTLKRWLETWAPDGVDDALYFETDEEIDADLMVA